MSETTTATEDVLSDGQSVAAEADSGVRKAIESASSSKDAARAGLSLLKAATQFVLEDLHIDPQSLGYSTSADLVSTFARAFASVLRDDKIPAAQQFRKLCSLIRPPLEAMRGMRESVRLVLAVSKGDGHIEASVPAGARKALINGGVTEEELRVRLGQMRNGLFDMPLITTGKIDADIVDVDREVRRILGLAA